MSTTGAPRYLSLDWARGLMMVATLLTVALLPPRPAQLVHAEWLDPTALDMIFPVFVLLSGVGLAFANRGRVRWRDTLRRSLTLLACGLAYNAVAEGSLDVATWRVTGPLTTYALLVLVIGVAARCLRGVGAWAAVTVVLAAAEVAFAAWWSASCPTGVLTPSCNASRVVDPLVLGAGHLYHQGELGYDPEGLIAFLGVLLTACVGMTAGQLVLRFRGSVLAALTVTAWAFLAYGGGAAASAYVEPFKRQWTPSFALLTAALGLSMLVVGIVVLDLPRVRLVSGVTGALAWPVVALGRNSLLMYFGSHALVDVLVRYGGERTWAEQLLGWFSFAPNPRVALLLAHAALWWALALLLHALRVYITAGGIKRVRRTPLTTVAGPIAATPADPATATTPAEPTSPAPATTPAEPTKIDVEVLGGHAGVSPPTRPH